MPKRKVTDVDVFYHEKTYHVRVHHSGVYVIVAEYHCRWPLLKKDAEAEADYYARWLKNEYGVR